jgi:hypothetical protein
VVWPGELRKFSQLLVELPRKHTKQNGDGISHLLAEKQYFSRFQKVTKGIEEAKEPIKIVEEWDCLYQNEAKSSVTKMSQIIQEMGLVVTRKARGKSQIYKQPM